MLTRMGKSRGYFFLALRAVSEGRHLKRAFLIRQAFGGTGRCFPTTKIGGAEKMNCEP
jgi:hypothetical protein